MQASATALPVPGPPALDRWIGRTHLHPAIDYLLVGGGVTIPIFIAIYFYPGLTAASTATSLNTFLVFNGAHFAASTVRLYTKRGAKEEFPFLSWGFPLVCLVVLAVGLSWPVLGRNLTNLYLSWSPYHYAAQTYGIAVMYAMKSGARLDDQDKRQIWWVCLLPFLYALAALAISFSGAGAFSFDALFGLTFAAEPHLALTLNVLAVIGAAVTLSVRRRNVPSLSKT